MRGKHALFFIFGIKNNHYTSIMKEKPKNEKNDGYTADIVFRIIRTNKLRLNKVNISWLVLE